MSMEYIRNTYRVPAMRGGRVQYDGDDPHEGPKIGTITGTRGANIRVRMDGEKRSGIYHPTWAMTYLSTQTAGDQAEHDMLLTLLCDINAALSEIDAEELAQAKPRSTSMGEKNA